jgi:hypothetical protein
VAVGALDPGTHRRRTGVFLALGTLVAVTLMYGVLRGPVVATMTSHYIAYDVGPWHGGTLAVLYVLVTCGSLLLSDHSHVRTTSGGARRETLSPPDEPPSPQDAPAPDA